MLRLVCLLALASCGHEQPAQPQPRPFAIPNAAHQLVTAITEDWTSTHATLQLWTRAGATWQRTGDAWPAVIGRTGAAWGVGLHGNGAPGREGPIKHEGDGKSPAGVFALRATYGYAAAPPAGTRLPYVALDERWECVDDPESRSYARIVNDGPGDWHSSERLRRSDELYRWVVDIAHNPESRPGLGSCIFLHVWSGPDSSTVGCTAMTERKLAQLIATLDPSALYVLLPRAEYAALAPVWGLPAP